MADADDAEMKWLITGRISSFDLETDNKIPADARIVTAAILGLGGGADRHNSEWVLKPSRPIAEEAASIHGYSTERAEAEGTDYIAGVDLIAGELALGLAREIPLVIYNAVYDLTVMETELHRLGLPTLTERLDGRPIAPIVDPLVLWRHAHKYLAGKRTLDVAATHFGVDSGDSHSCTDDALAAARVAYRIAQIVEMPEVRSKMGYKADVNDAYAKLAGLDAGRLHELQQYAYRASSESLKAYWIKNKKPQADIDGITFEWPIRSAS